MAKAKVAKIALPTLAEMADELGALEKEYAIMSAPFEMKLPRMNALKEALQEACPARPTEEWKVEGTRFGVRLGPCANQRSINIPKLIKAVGAAVFAKFATCTLKALEESVAPEIVDQVVKSEASGPRKLSTFEKGIHLVR